MQSESIDALHTKSTCTVYLEYYGVVLGEKIESVWQSSGLVSKVIPSLNPVYIPAVNALVAAVIS